MTDQQHDTGLASKYPYIPEHREALAKMAGNTDGKGIPTLAALAAQGELLRYDIVELQKALIAAGEHLYNMFPDEHQAKREGLMETITEALQSTGGATPWIAWSGQLEELPEETEDECTCSKGDHFCPVHNADYARYIRS